MCQLPIPRGMCRDWLPTVGNGCGEDGKLGLGGFGTGASGRATWAAAAVVVVGGEREEERGRSGCCRRKMFQAIWGDVSIRRWNFKRERKGRAGGSGQRSGAALVQGGGLAELEAKVQRKDKRQTRMATGRSARARGTQAVGKQRERRGSRPSQCRLG